MRPHFDVAIVGGGIAGLAAALSLPPSLRAAVLIKGRGGGGSSAWAQGGMAAAVGGDDSPDSHIADTLNAGGGLCNEEAVRALAEGADDALRWLQKMGVDFNRARGGQLHLAREGGHRRRRIAHVDDATGSAMQSALLAQAQRRKNLTFLKNHTAVDLVVEDGQCRGLYAGNREKDGVAAINASAVLLATGGAGKVYLYTTNPDEATGDGIAMAYRAGCRMRDMEFYQFHPTALYHPLARSFLISEAMRGEGAALINAQGARFMQDAELAPRDEVARAIDAETKRSGAPCVYLDARGRDDLRKKFPTIHKKCLSLGLDFVRQPLPVVPAAHYCCGGVLTDSGGATDIAALYAAGEAASAGIHGANRLAGNSLLECVVFARAAAARMAGENAAPKKKTTPPPVAAWDERRVARADELVSIAHNWQELRRLMWNYVGIVRSDERLARARRRLEIIREEIAHFYGRHIINRDFVELRNLADCAALIIEGALARRESRGLHFNVDCAPGAGEGQSTLLSRRDFEFRARAVNDHCPFSGRGIAANALMEWRGAVAGFCNPGCRDDFKQAAARDFKNASGEMLRARDVLQQALKVN